MALTRQVLSVLAAVVLCLAAQSSHVNALSSAAPPKKFNGGAGMGRLVIDDLTGAQDAVSCHYDMVLVERIQGNPKKESGLYVPDADLPRLHLCRVLSMGTGREEENGHVSPMPDIQVGDVVIAKNPWGIGPKDEETTSGKKLSFMRSQDIAAVITGGLTEESIKDTL
jgi:co-chaperonin GroES (HSP10)